MGRGARHNTAEAVPIRKVRNAGARKGADLRQFIERRQRLYATGTLIEAGLATIQVETDAVRTTGAQGNTESGGKG